MTELLNEKIIKAILEADYCKTKEEAQELAEDCFFAEDVLTYKELGEYCAEQFGTFDNIPENVLGYIDYELYGHDMSLNGCFTKYGFIQVD